MRMEFCDECQDSCECYYHGCKEERLRPGGSSPASCSRTREAGRKHDATTDHTTAPPFPDQGWDGVQRLVDELKKEAESRSLSALAIHNLPVISLKEHHERVSAVYDEIATKLTDLRAESLTQSEAGGNEVCRCEGGSTTLAREQVPHTCARCEKPIGTLSERERSGSGNAESIHPDPKP